MPRSTAAKDIYFIDASVAGDALSLGLGDGSNVFVLESNSDAFLQMAQALASLKEPVDAVHVYSHGAEGMLVLGGRTYDAAALDESAEKIGAISQYLKEGADVLLYACNTGAGTLGERFLEQLSRLIGADVAASEDITGPSGDWDLEKTAGVVRTQPQPLPQAQTDLDAGAPSSSGDVPGETPPATGDPLSGWGNLPGTADAEKITGFVSNDRIIGHGGKDTLIGGDGNDIYIIDGSGTEGARVLEAAQGGVDTVFSRVADFDLSAGGDTSQEEGVSAQTSEVEHIVLQAQGAMDAQSATGNDVGQTMTGNALSNNLTGKGGNDLLDGGDGDDFLDGGSGVKDPAALRERIDYLTGDRDTLAGGKGNDSYIVRNKGDKVVENKNEGIDHVYALVDHALAANVEHLTLLDGGQALAGAGNALNNELRGNSSANALSGGAGNDTLHGGRHGEADTLDGGAGNDAFYVYSDRDTIIDSAGNDSIFSSADYDLGNAPGVENLYLLGDATRASGNALNNRIRGNMAKGSTLSAGSGGANTLEGGDYDDHYILTGDAKTLASKDVIIDSGGRNSVESAYTVNLASFSQAQIQSVTLTGTASIHATAGNVATSMTGNSGSNRLTGGAGNDTLDGGAGGADTLAGGAGNDLYYVRNRGAAVTEAANGGTDTVISSIDYTLGANVEHLTLRDGASSATGNSLANRIDASGNNGANTVLHGGRNDQVLVRAAVTNKQGKVTSPAVYAAPAGDTLRGSAGDNVIYSYNANDVIELHAASQSNVIYVCYDLPTVPQSTADWAKVLGVDAALLSDVVYLGDPARSGAVGASVTGSSAATLLTGTVRNDTLAAARDMASTLDGGAGADLMTGGTRGDTFYIDNANDRIRDGGNGVGVYDTVRSTISINLNSRELLKAATKNAKGQITSPAVYGDSLYAGAIGQVELQGAAKLNATGWSDAATTLMGNSAANVLTGGAEGDHLDGGAGADTMTGGLGDDTYVVDNAGDSVVESANGGRDSILTNGVHINLGSASHGSGNVEYVKNISGANGVSMTGTAAAEEFVAGDRGDTIDGRGGADTIVGGAGNDLIHYYGRNAYAGGATDVVDGGGGRDTLYVHAGVAAVDAGDPVRTFEAVQLDSATAFGVRATDLDASASSHGMAVIGNAGSSSMTGSAHDDTIQAGGGQDTIDAGAGDDFVELSNNWQIKTSTVTKKVTTRVKRGNKYVNVTNTVTSKVTSTVNGGAYGRVDGGDGEDTLSFGGANDNIVFSAPAEGADGGSVTVSGYLYGANATFHNFEAFSGGAGNDTLNAANTTTGMVLAGGAGNDSLRGGLGNDTFILDGGNDTVATGGGRDTIRLTPAAAGHTLTFTDFDYSLDTVNDSGLTGWARTVTQSGANATVVWANPENGAQKITAVFQNTLAALIRFGRSESVAEGDFDASATDANVPWEITATGTGQAIAGGDMGDTLLSRGSHNRLSGGRGNDSLTGGDGDTLEGGEGNDQLSVSGASGGFSMDGGDGNDLLLVNGQAHDFTMRGGAGDDQLSISGEAGGFSMDGGDGDDSFAIDRLGDTATGGTSEITGGAGKDSLFVNGVSEHAQGVVSVNLGGQEHDSVYLGGDRGKVVFNEDGEAVTLGVDGVEAAVSMTGVDRYHGTPGDDTIDASAVTASGAGIRFATNGGNDSFTGGAGADMVDVSGFTAATAVSLDGGGNTDRLQIGNRENLAVTVDGNGGGSAIAIRGSTSQITNFEQIRLAGENTADTVTVSDLAQLSNLTVETGKGSDSLVVNGADAGSSNAAFDGGDGKDSVTVNISAGNDLKVTLQHQAVDNGDQGTATVLAASLSTQPSGTAGNDGYAAMPDVRFENFEYYNAAAHGTFFDASALTSVDANGLTLEGGTHASNEFELGRLTAGQVSLAGGEAGNAFSLRDGLAGGGVSMRGGAGADSFTVGAIADGARVRLEGRGGADTLAFVSGVGAAGVHLVLNADGSVKTARFGTGSDASGLAATGIAVFEGGNGDDTLDAGAAQGDLTLSGGAGANQIKTANNAGASTRVLVTGQDAITLGGGADTLVLSDAAARRGGTVTVSGYDIAKDRIDESDLISRGWERAAANMATGGVVSYTYYRTDGDATYTVKFMGATVRPLADIKKVGDSHNLTISATEADFSGAIYGTEAGDTIDASAAAGPATVYGNGGADEITGTRGGDSIVVNGGSEGARVNGLRGIATRTRNDGTQVTGTWMLADGNDTIRVDGAITGGDYWIEGGTGSDSISLGDISGGTVDVYGRAELKTADNTGRNDDTIAVGDITNGVVRVHANGGVNSITIGDIGSAGGGPSPEYVTVHESVNYNVEADDGIRVFVRTNGTVKECFTTRDESEAQYWLAQGVRELSAEQIASAGMTGYLRYVSPSTTTVNANGTVTFAVPTDVSHTEAAPYVKLSAGDGNDSFKVGDVYYGRLVVDTDNGQDTITTGDIHGGDVLLHGQYYHGHWKNGTYYDDTAYGNYTFDVGDVRGGNVALVGDDGSDTFSIKSIGPDARVTVSGGNNPVGTNTGDHLLFTGDSVNVVIRSEWDASAANLHMSGVEYVRGTAGNDSMDAGEYEPTPGVGLTLHGGEGNDTLAGGDGILLTGGKGDDLLMPTSAWGATTVRGGDGSDTLSLERIGPAGMSLTATGLSFGAGGITLSDSLETIRLADATADGTQNSLNLTGKVTGTTVQFGTARDVLYVDGGANGSSVTVKGYDAASDSIATASNWTSVATSVSGTGTTYTYSGANKTSAKVFVEGLYVSSNPNVAQSVTVSGGQNVTVVRGNANDSITANLGGDNPATLRIAGSGGGKTEVYLNLTGTTHALHTLQNVEGKARLYLDGASGVSAVIADSVNADGGHTPTLRQVIANGKTADNLAASGFTHYYFSDRDDTVDATGLRAVGDLKINTRGGADSIAVGDITLQGGDGLEDSRYFSLVSDWDEMDSGNAGKASLAGNDTISVGNMIAHGFAYAAFAASGGKDSIAAGDVSVDGATTILFMGGTGNDTVQVGDITMQASSGYASVGVSEEANNAGANSGDDSITVGDISMTYSGDADMQIVDINSGAGNDTISVGSMEITNIDEVQDWNKISLDITGGAGNDRISLGGGAGRVQVHALYGEGVRGGEQSGNLPLDDGDDTITVTGDITGGTYAIEGGLGDDSITLQNITGGTVSVLGRTWDKPADNQSDTDNDTITAGDITGGNVTLKANGGYNTLHVGAIGDAGGASAPSVTLDTGSKDDAITVGNVYSGTLEVGADNGDDTITVGTLADGAAVTVSAHGGADVISLGGGAGSMLVWAMRMPGQYTHEDGTVDTGTFIADDGDDTITVTGDITGGRCVIEGGLGNDSITLQGVTGGTVTVYGRGDGKPIDGHLETDNDTITAGDITGGSVTLKANGGYNALHVGDIGDAGGASAPSVTLDTGGKDDTITVGNVYSGTLELVSDNGDDSISVASVDLDGGDSVFLAANDGDDSISVGSLHMNGGSFTVNAGAGNDTVSLNAVNIEGAGDHVSINGGEGSDTYRLQVLPSSNLLDIHDDSGATDADRVEFFGIDASRFSMEDLGNLQFSLGSYTDGYGEHALLTVSGLEASAPYNDMFSFFFNDFTNDSLHLYATETDAQGNQTQRQLLADGGIDLQSVVTALQNKEKGYSYTLNFTREGDTLKAS